VAFSLTWLSQVLLDAGLKVAEQPGWQSRGRGDVGKIIGVICHHTSGAKTGNMPSLGVVINGREDLAGPLAQLCLGRDGTFYVVAAGRCNHAGKGNWQGFTSGNTNFIGIEAENTGELRGPKADFPWPPVQMDAYRHGVAAILKKIGANAIMCCGHKEYALPHGRKDDPVFDMNEFRRDVAAIMADAAPQLSIIPDIDSAGRPTLRRGDTGDLVKQIQTKLGVGTTGNLDGETEAAIRQFQFDHGLVPDGIVGPRAWATLDSLPDTSAMTDPQKAVNAIASIAAATKAKLQGLGDDPMSLLRRAIVGSTDPELTASLTTAQDQLTILTAMANAVATDADRAKDTTKAAASSDAAAQQAKDNLGQLMADTSAFERALAGFQDARNTILRKTAKG
jgi:peptidoglycan hydrolase-like protein with peptidoglycan-binding domain